MCLGYATRWHFFETFLGVYETTAIFPDNLCGNKFKVIKDSKKIIMRSAVIFLLVKQVKQSRIPAKRKITMQTVQRWRKQVNRQDHKTSTGRRFVTLCPQQLNEGIRFFCAHLKLVASLELNKQTRKEPFIITTTTFPLSSPALSCLAPWLQFRAPNCLYVRCYAAKAIRHSNDARSAENAVNAYYLIPIQLRVHF